MKLINADETAFNLTTYNNGTNNGSSAYAFKHGLYYNSTENAAVTFYRGGSSVGGFLTFTTNNGTERMRIDSAGNVGIGTSAPGARIDIKGVAGSPATSGTTQNGILRIQNATNNNTLDIGQVAGSPYGTWLQAADKSDLNPTYTYPILLNPLGGNVGIGTTSPGAKLEITTLRENGIRLSGGEKQRLSIARAMIKKSPIILLDEATSSLDSETESKIQDALKILTKDRTTIVIAHRLSTILNSDQIYIIDAGNVVANGKHDELLNTSELYKNFYEKQIQKK